MSKSSEPVSNGGGKYATSQSQLGEDHGAVAMQSLDPALLHGAVVAVLLAGDAILLGTTRDGGAVAMQLYSGESIDKLYAATLIDLETVLRGILSAAEG